MTVAPRYPKETRILGLRLSDAGVPEVHEFIGKTIDQNQKALVMNLNIHCVNIAGELPWFKDFINEAPLIFCDGDGVRWGVKLLGNHPPPKITFAAWIWQLAEFAAKKGHSFYLLGSKPGVAARAAERLKEKFPELKIAGTHDGYFNHTNEENEEVIREINRVKPDILIVGFGMPVQEKWLKLNWERLDCHIFLNGGAVFDYTSGILSRAPEWMLKLHMEWLFRFFQEPRRLFKRYLIGNPKFIMNVLRERMQKKK